MEKVQLIEIARLHDFRNHPFKVNMDTELFNLMESIKKEGVIVPLLVRPDPEGEGYEILAGHRRKLAAKWAGLKEVPVLIRNFDDDQSIILMVDSNLQRENLKPSEKAFAYRMKLEAMNRQGKRGETTSCQVGTKLNPTAQVAEVGIEETEEGYRFVNLSREVYIHETSGDELAKEAGESRRQIYRYIRLTYLIPKILEIVDEGKIAFTIAVELSYLKEEEQYELHAVMDLEQCTPSLSQAGRLKRYSRENKLDMDMIYIILEEEKPNQREQIKIRADILDQYFPDDFTPVQKVELIQELVKNWSEKQNPKVDKSIRSG